MENPLASQGNRNETRCHMEVGGPCLVEPQRQSRYGGGSPISVTLPWGAGSDAAGLMGVVAQPGVTRFSVHAAVTAGDRWETWGGI